MFDESLVLYSTVGAALVFESELGSALRTEADHSAGCLTCRRLLVLIYGVEEDGYGYGLYWLHERGDNR